MPEAERDLIRAEYRAIERQDWESLFADAHPYFVLKPPAASLAQAEPGREGAREAMRTFFSAYEEVAIELLEFRAHGDRIAVTFALRTRPRGSGAVVEIRAGHVWTIRDGRLAALEIFPRREQAFEVLETPPT